MDLKDEIKEQFALLREVTRTTNVLHDAQVHHLKMWSRVYFSESIGVTLKVSFEKKNIEFMMPVVGKRKPDRNSDTLADSAAIQMLGQSVQWLLGPDWSVKARLAGPGRGNSRILRYPEA